MSVCCWVSGGRHLATARGWMDGWMDGWMEGWMDGGGGGGGGLY